MIFSNELIFKDTMPSDGNCCVYRLIKDGVGVVYVGQSLGLTKRIRDHINSDKDFDRFEYQIVGKDSANEIECYDIVKLNPKLNTQLPPNESNIQITTLKKILLKEFTNKIEEVINTAPVTFDRSVGTNKKYTYVSADILKEISGVIKSINQSNKVNK